MSEVQTIKTLLHEMAHATLHGVSPDTNKPVALSRNQKEVEAESVAFTICSHFGMDTSDYSFFYIAGWSSGKDIKELKASLDTIRITAGSIIDGIEKELRIGRIYQEEIGNLARDIDSFAYQCDTYEYLDTVEDPEVGFEIIRTAILEGEVEYIREWLQEVVDNTDLSEERKMADSLLKRLDILTSGHFVQKCEKESMSVPDVKKQKQEPVVAERINMIR